MSDARCKNCRWWGANSQSSDEPLDISHPCEHEKVGSDSDEQFPDGCGGFSEGSKYNEVIFTGPDFGCVHFEAKE